MSPDQTLRTSGPLRKRTATDAEPAGVGASSVPRLERADAARNREVILRAADALFAGSASPNSVSMDDIAHAAGVGKGTLFRRFGDRTGLVRAVFATRTEPLRRAITAGPPPLGPGTEPRTRVVAILDALIGIKLDNRHLSLAVEDGLIGGSLYQAPQYVELHALLATELARLLPADHADWTAHALLAVTRADLIDHLRLAEGMTRADLLDHLGAHLARLLPGLTRPAASQP